MVKTVEGEKLVEAKSSLKFCNRFMFPPKKGTCDQRSCDKLHICRKFLEESCILGERCKKPHTFEGPVTQNLLIQHNLDSLSSDKLKTLFQKALKDHKITYFASTSGPRGCALYRKGSTCKGGDKCKFLHVCDGYINGSCKSGEECGLCHSFETKHARRVLASHNLGDLHNEKKILRILRKNMKPQEQPRPCHKKPRTLDMKLFSHLVASGEKCCLQIADVEKFLQEFSVEKVINAITSFLVNICSFLGHWIKFN